MADFLPFSTEPCKAPKLDDPGKYWTAMLLPFLQEISPFFLKWKMNFLSHRFLGARVDRFLEVRLVASWDGSYGMTTGSGFCSSTGQDQTGTPAINQVPRCWLQRCLTCFFFDPCKNLTKCFLFGFNGWFNHYIYIYMLAPPPHEPTFLCCLHCKRLESFRDFAWFGFLMVWMWCGVNFWAFRKHW